MRLPWSIHLKCVNPNRGGGGPEGGNDSRDDRTIEQKLKVQIDYNAKDECLIVNGEIKISNPEDQDLFNIKIQNYKNWSVSAALMIGDTFLNKNC